MWELVDLLLLEENLSPCCLTMDTSCHVLSFGFSHCQSKLQCDVVYFTCEGKQGTAFVLYVSLSSLGHSSMKVFLDKKKNINPDAVFIYKAFLVGGGRGVNPPVKARLTILLGNAHF